MDREDPPSGLDRRSFLRALASAATGLGAVAGAGAAAVQAPLIDTHMHVWSGDLNRFPCAHPWERHVQPPKTPATVELLLGEMEQFHITHCVLVQTIYHGWDNRYLAQCVNAQPQHVRCH